MKSWLVSMTSAAPWIPRSLTLVPVAIMISLTASCAGRPPQFYTGAAYIHLSKGEQFQAPRDMTLATEAVIQEKDAQIVDLIGALRKIQAERDLK